MGLGRIPFFQLGKGFEISPLGSLSPLHRPVREKNMEGFTMAILSLPGP